MKTVVFDFDGVIHSYKTGWQGDPAIIPDEPVPGIREVIGELQTEGYEVVVVSTRCRTTEGAQAVEKYLMKNQIGVSKVMSEKPPAICYIDDRAICFDGNTESLLNKIQNFKPWNSGY